MGRDDGAPDADQRVSALVPAACHRREADLPGPLLAQIKAACKAGGDAAVLAAWEAAWAQLRAPHAQVLAGNGGGRRGACALRLLVVGFDRTHTLPPAVSPAGTAALCAALSAQRRLPACTAGAAPAGAVAAVAAGGWRASLL